MANVTRGKSHPTRVSLSLRAALLVLAAHTTLACAGSGPSTVTQHEHVVSGGVELYAGRYRVVGYDPEDARLLRVTAELEELFGRPIALRFASDMMPHTPAFLESLFDSELGKLPQVMSRWQHSHPDAFAAMTAGLEHIDFDYDGALPEATSEFGKEPGRMLFVLNSWEVPTELVQRVMYNAHQRWQRARYLERTPEQVPATERLAYLEALIDQGATHFFVAARNQHASDESAPSEPSPGRTEVILRTLRLAAVAGDHDATLSHALTEQLLDDGSYFRDCYENHPKFVSSAPALSKWADAEHQWMQWALNGLKTLPAEARYKLFDTLLVPASTSPRLAQHERAFPGFDVESVGLELLGEWVKAGYPTAAGKGQPAEDPKVRLFDRVLCPAIEDERGAFHRRAQNCRATFYATALTDDTRRQRLLDAIVFATDAKVRILLSANLIEMARSSWSTPKGTAVPSILELLRRLEPHRAQWQELVRRLALEIDASDELREALYDQTVRYYRARPADRGVLLFLLARIDGYGRTPVAWKDFTATYGAKITTSELATFLEQSPLAFEKFRLLTPAFDASGSPGSVVASKLSGYLDSAAAGRDLQLRGRIVSTIGNELKKLSDWEGLERLHQELRRYIGTDPGRERELRDLNAELRALLQSRTQAE